MNNYVSESAERIFVSGNDNSIGQNCQNVSIINSSGCIVYGGLRNVSVINSSGVTVTENNISYIRNRVYSSESDGVTQTNSSYSEDHHEYYVYCNTTSGSIVYEPPSAPTNKGRQISVIKTDAGANTVSISTAAGTRTLTTQYDTLVISSDGTSWYPISKFNTTIGVTPTLSQVLAAGNTTGANDIIITNGATREIYMQDGTYRMSYYFNPTYNMIRTYNSATGNVVYTYWGENSLTINGGATFPGTQYGSDYSANFTARSLVDKGYVSSNFAASSGTILITDKIALTAQTADIADTAFTGNTAGVYRLGYYLLTTTADGTAGTATLNIKHTDNAASRTNSTSINLNTTGAGGIVQGDIVIRLNSGNITYGITHTGIYGTSVYALYLTLERIQ
jgi:hypothetical protein